MSFIYFSEQEKQAANESDIVSFLQRQGQEVKRCGREYMWDSPSGKVSINGSEWYSQYERVGGGAVSFVQKFFDASYPNAIKALIGYASGQEINNKTYSFSRKEKEKAIPAEVKLPEASPDMHRLYGYLLHERCLDREVVHAFIHKGILYEDAVNHNAVFVGLDEKGVARHVQKRSTVPQSSFKNNLEGSDAAYAFHHIGTSDRLYVFEAPIDMLAFISLHKAGWEQHSYVALCSTADCAAIRMLKTYPNLKSVYLCLDHDSAGIEGAYRVAESIHALGDYSVWRKMPEHKDWDEDLKALHGKEAIPASEHQKLNAFLEQCEKLPAFVDENHKAFESVAKSKGYVVEKTFEKLRSELEKSDSDIDPRTTQKRLGKMAVICLGFCCCRDGQTQKAFNIDDTIGQIRSAYKPHQDIGDSTRQAKELKQSLASLEKDIRGKETLSASEMTAQKEKVCSFTMECLRLASTLGREQEQTPLTLHLA